MASGAPGKWAGSEGAVSWSSLGSRVKCIAGNVGRGKRAGKRSCLGWRREPGAGLSVAHTAQSTALT